MHDIADSQQHLSSEQITKQRLQLLAQKKQIQQRQILAMMGIDQWVRPDSATISIAEIEAQTVVLQDEKQLISVAHSNNNASELLNSNLPNNINRVDYESPSNDTQNLTVQPTLTADAPVIYDKATATGKPNTNLIVDETSVDFENHQNQHESDSRLDSLDSEDAITDALEPIKVAPFDLEGGRYGDWVLLVDIQALNSDSQKLWQNIVQALSLDCETSFFPICEGMDTAELANASLAGYVFKIARSEDIKVAALTDLPKGLTHPNFTRVATLDMMLENSIYKRQFWEQLSS